MRRRCMPISPAFAFRGRPMRLLAERLRCPPLAFARAQPAGRSVPLASPSFHTLVDEPPADGLFVVLAGRPRRHLEDVAGLEDSIVVRTFGRLRIIGPVHS